MSDLSVFEVAVVIAAMVSGGLVKGCVGIGQPTAALAVMANFLTPLTALAGNVFPMLVTNFIQAREAPSMRRVIHAERYLMLAMAVGLAIGALLVPYVPGYVLMLSIGMVIVWFAAMELTGFRLSGNLVRTPLKDTALGFIAGVLGGITTLWAPPLILYYSALDLKKEDFIHKSGAVIFIGSIVLTVNYALNGILAGKYLWLSLIGILPAIAGYYAGRAIRNKLDQEQFRKLLLVVFLFGGLSILWRGLRASGLVG